MISNKRKGIDQMKTKVYVLNTGYGTELVKLTEGQKKFFDWLFESGYISGDFNGIEELKQDTITDFPEEDD